MAGDCRGWTRDKTLWGNTEEELSAAEEQVGKGERHNHGKGGGKRQNDGCPTSWDREGQYIPPWSSDQKDPHSCVC